MLLKDASIKLLLYINVIQYMYSASHHNINFYCFRYILNHKNALSLWLLNIYIKDILA